MHRAIYAGCHNALRGRQNAVKSHQNASGGHQNASRGHQNAKNAQKCSKLSQTMYKNPQGSFLKTLIFGDFWRFLTFMTQFWSFPGQIGQKNAQKCPKMHKSAQTCPNMPQTCPKACTKTLQGSKHRFLAIFGDFRPS